MISELMMTDNISAIIHKDVVINLDIAVDPKVVAQLDLNDDKYERFKKIIKNSYITEYYNMLKKYGSTYVEGTGAKTNGYYEPKQNLAYNYFKHPDFLRTAKEPSKGYDKSGNSVDDIVSYNYYQNVWSVVCDEVKRKYHYNFCIKLDHRHKNHKNNDFDGILYVYDIYDNSFWKDRNLPNNQRY